MNQTATNQGAVDPDVKSGEVAVSKSPRDVMLESMAERQEEQHQQMVKDDIEGDAGMQAWQGQIESEMRENAQQDDAPTGETDGAQSLEPMHEEQPQSNLPSNLQDDPLADFIEMSPDGPMVKAKVNGESKLIPLQEAKRQLQIGVAAESRMQSAVYREREIDTREQRLKAGEAAFAARMKQQAAPAATPEPQGLSQEELQKEAEDIFATAFSGTEADAAKKLAATLNKMQQSIAATQPAVRIDEDALAARAAQKAYGQMSAEQKQQAEALALDHFKSTYSEIMEDPNLFKMADDFTTQIEQEHPHWTPTQVFDEAGKRTRAWVDNQRSDDTDTDQAPQDADTNASVATHDTQSRQERKEGLVRMPTSAPGAVHSEPAEDDGEKPQTPQEALAEIRAARGQPT